VLAGTILVTGLGGIGFELAPDLTTIRTVEVGDRGDVSTGARRPQQSRTHVAHADNALEPVSGWLMTTTHLDTATELTVWDADDLSTPLATISIPRPIPPSTHTTWVPAITTHSKGASQ
jgi:carotenoid cleavage dioxygenase-like enzyme